MDLFPTFRRFLAGPGPTFGWPWRTTIGQQHSLMRLIAIAQEQQIPLAELLQHWAEDERGWQSGRIRRLVKLLADGKSLADAAEAVPGLLRDEDLLALRFDQQSGTRTAAIRMNLADGSPTDIEPWSHMRRSRAYFATVLLICLAVNSFMHLQIFPVLEKMLSEFGFESPAALRWATSLAWHYVLIAMAMALLGLWLFSGRVGRRVRQAIASRLFRSVHEIRAAEVLQYLDVAVTAGRPLPSAVSTLARYHFDPSIRHELLVVRNEVEQGLTVWSSMSDVGLLSPPEAEALIIAERHDSLGWTLQQLSNVKRTRVTRRAERIGELMFPICILLLAMIVMVQAFAVFIPLITLMEGLI